jgi:Mn2+/Fe2+ NRAMP family transporter
VNFSFVSISSAVALLGATISPYNMFWQVQGEKEEKRTGSTNQKVRGAALDIAVGLIGAGLVAIPILLASTSYAITGTFGWPAGLSKKPWQNEGFYLILTGALLVSIVIALAHVDPIRLIFWANVLSGVLAPILVVYLIVIANNRTIMRKQRIGFLTNAGLVITALVMFVAAFLFFYGLLTGQGG